jgi:hypothetical protein
MAGPDGSVTVLAMDGQARWRRPWPRLAPEVADGLLGLAVADPAGVCRTTHVGRVLAKLGLRDRVEAVIWAYEAGLVQPGR